MPAETCLPTRRLSVVVAARGSYVPAEWLAGSTAKVSSSATRINGAFPVTNNAGTFYQVVWGSLQTDKKKTNLWVLITLSLSLSRVVRLAL